MGQKNSTYDPKEALKKELDTLYNRRSIVDGLIRSLEQYSQLQSLDTAAPQHLQSKY